MCGRYAVTSNPEAIRALSRYLDQPDFPPRYNVAPTQPVPVVRLAEGTQFALVRWGLIPAWVKDPRDLSLLINARAEFVMDRPAFRNAMKRRRCLFPADGFYECGRQEGEPQAALFRSARGPGGPVAFAGLWETWMGPERGGDGDRRDRHHAGRTRWLTPIHDRMPVVILSPEAFDFWLDCRKVDAEDRCGADRRRRRRRTGGL